MLSNLSTFFQVVNECALLLSWVLQGIYPWILCVCACAKSLQCSPTLCDPMDCSPPGSYVRGILQARMLE